MAGACLSTCAELLQARETTEDVVVVCAGQRGDKDQQKWLPGAIFVEVDAEIELWSKDAEGRLQLTYGAGNLLPTAALQAAIEDMGICASSQVYVYTNLKDDISSPIVATRLIWALCYAGVDRVSLVDGGIDEWERCGHEVVHGHAAARSPARDFFTGETRHMSMMQDSTACKDEKRVFPGRPWLLATTEEVESLVTCEDHEVGGIIGDVRSWKEYTGQSHEYTYFNALGRIPGARWAGWGPSTYIGGDFACHGRIRDLSEVQQLWRWWGICPNNAAEHGEVQKDSRSAMHRRIIFHCGSGWRSSFAWFMASLMGWRNVANYDGGWLEWSTCHPRAPSLPKLTGEKALVVEDEPTGEPPLKRVAVDSSEKVFANLN